MPYKSAKQARYMHWAAAHGKLDKSVVAKFDREEEAKAHKSVKPEHKKKANGGKR